MADSTGVSLLIHQFTVPESSAGCEEYTDSFRLTDLLVQYSDVGEEGVIDSAYDVSDPSIGSTCTGVLSVGYNVDVDVDTPWTVS